MQHWDSYWQTTKTLNSFAEGEQQTGYNGDIAKFWQQTFSDFPTDAKVLDLATGNGGLAVLAKQFNNNFDVYGSDAANINPTQLFDRNDAVYPILQSIHFSANMLSEHLTFSDGTFDAVISQFGFEYAPLKAALTQIHRVLKSTGSFTALVHHKESFITKDCLVGLTMMEHFLSEKGLLSGMAKFALLCERLHRHQGNKVQLEFMFRQQNMALLGNFKNLQQQLKSEAEVDWFNSMAQECITLIMNWQTLSVTKVANLKSRLNHFKLRLQDQVNAAWGIEELAFFTSEAEPAWMSTTADTVKVSEGILCWMLRLSK